MRANEAGSAAREPREPTAAMNALSAMEALIDDMRRIKAGLEEIADRAGQLQKSDNSDSKEGASLRPARAGIIGDIHQAVDMGRDFAIQIESLTKRVSTQI